LNFWVKKKRNLKLKNKFSSQIISFREIKMLFTTFSSFQVLFRGILNISFFQQDKTLFSFFYTDWATIVSLKNLSKFSEQSFFLKSGFVLFFIFFKLFFLYYYAFLYRYIKKITILSFFNLSFLIRSNFILKFKKKNLFLIKKKSFFFIKNENIINYINDAYFEEYSRTNFSLKKKDNRWNLKKKGINVPFRNLFWNDESSFVKKKLKWKIRTKEYL
jgi:hypothetical protein